MGVSRGKRAIILKGADWVGLFVDGVLKQQGHVLFEGSYYAIIKFAEEHGLSSFDFDEQVLSSDERTFLKKTRSFPNTLIRFWKRYEEYRSNITR